MLRILLLVAGSTALAVAESQEALALRGFRAEAIRAHMQFLADDLLEGRETGSRGFDVAARYVATQLQLLGLAPSGVDGSYFQPIRFRSAKLAPEKTSLTVRRGDREESLVYGKDFFSQANLLSLDFEIAGELVYAGFGIVAPELKVDDFRNLDVRGKIVAVRIGTPNEFPPAERAHFGALRLKREIAKSKGAIGLVVIRDQEAEKRTRFATAVARSVLPGMEWLDERGEPNEAGRGVPIVATLSVAAGRKLVGDSIGPGPLNASMSARIVSAHSTVASANILGVLPGSHPVLRQEYVVYTAHLDHVGMGASFNGDRIFNGAQDNAAGVAGLLEIARAFAGMRPAPRRSILFLVVTGEEKGLLGSDYFVQHPTVPMKSIVANVNVEGLGLAYDFRDVVALGAEYSSIGDDVAKAARRLDLAVTPDWMPEQLFFTRSDQYSFVKRGVPSVFHFFGVKAANPGVDARAEITKFLSTHYHQPSDDMTQPMNFDAGVKWCRFDFLVGSSLAQNTARPKWKLDNFFGRTFGKSGNPSSENP